MIFIVEILLMMIYGRTERYTYTVEYRDAETQLKREVKSVERGKNHWEQQ